MKKIDYFIKTSIVILLIIILLLVLISFYNLKNYKTEIKPGSTVQWNADFITNLNKNEINLSDYKQVFSYLFENMPEEITVYPTENYFYFKFPYSGKVIGGTINLGADDRDKGILGFGYKGG